MSDMSFQLDVIVISFSIPLHKLAKFNNVSLDRTIVAIQPNALNSK